MNAAIRSVVLAAHSYDIEVIGFYHGYNGLINDDGRPLTPLDVHGIIHKGGTILKSARCPEMLTSVGVNQVAGTLLKNKIDALVVIGGDGSFKGLIEVEKVWGGKTIGLPGTIDNDLDCTDYTIGFSTAINTGIDAIDKIRDTADAFDRIFIVELMGRHSGQIAFNVGIASAAEQVLSFENFDSNDVNNEISKIANDILCVKQKYDGSYIIVMAENLIDGGAFNLASLLKAKVNIDCTACVLGHIQRGGTPVAKDRLLATKLGVSAIQGLTEGRTSVMVGELNNAVNFSALDEVIKQNKKVSPRIVNAQKNIFALTN